MIKFVMVAGLAIAASGPVHSATLSYYGQYYTEASGSGPEYGYGFGSDAVGNTLFPDGYDQGMRVELKFEMEKPLLANTEFEFYNGAFRSGDYVLDVISFSYSDGLYERTPSKSGYGGGSLSGFLKTNEFSHVTNWDFFAYNGGGYDRDIIQTSSTRGDRASHQREYITPEPNAYLAGVASEAFVANPGVWLYDTTSTPMPVPAPIPVPASLPLVLSGLGLLAYLRQRSRQA